MVPTRQFTAASTAHLKRCAWLAAVLCALAGYAWANRLGAALRFSTHTWLDDRMPLIPEFVFVYVLYFPWLLWGLKLAFEHGRACRELRVFVFVNLMACAIFVLLPTQVERPPIDSAMQGAAFTLLRWVYAADMPYAVCPSLHVANALLLARLFCGDRRYARLAPLWIALAVGIMISVVAVKQHHLVDVLGGLILGWCAVAGILDRETRRQRAFREEAIA